MTPMAALCVGVTLAAGLWPFGSSAPAPGRNTIGTLKQKSLELHTEAPAPADSSAQAMAHYREFLALNTGPSDMRAEAMRRLADLNLEAGVTAEAAAEGSGAGAGNFAEAVQLYRDLLATYPDRKDQDQVVYQLARALEGAGRGDEALTSLDGLVAAHPDATHFDEAEFRRGETNFVRQNYVQAEQAYAAVTGRGPGSSFYEQALYKQGWSLFKQGRHEESLNPFLVLLDRRLGGAPGAAPAPPLDDLSRPERELLDDTLRVVSITFSYTDGTRSIDGVMAQRGGRPWEYLLYASLGDLYLDKERYRDAAEAYQAFVAHDPVNEQAPRLQQSAIDAYMKGRFPSLVLAAKQQYVERYGLESPYWQPGSGPRPPRGSDAVVVAQLKTHLSDLASHDHALAQQSRVPADYERAAGWYRRYLAYFPEDPDSAQRSFLLGELLFESRHFDQARDAYLHAAYDYSGYARADEAGYAALLAARQHEATLADAAKTAWHGETVEQALRFAEAFPAHPQAGAVLTNVAEELYAGGQTERAIRVAGLVATLQPPATPELERVAWTVMAHAQFDLGRFAEAENSYVRLQTYPMPAAQRADVDARVAASIYRQAEQAAAAGEVDAAVANYLRIAAVTPGAEIRPNALFDAATLLVNSQRWDQAVDLLQRFRQEFPAHRFNGEVTTKLAVALKEGGRGAEAAAEYERIAGTPGPAGDVQREALWQAADLYGRTGQTASEARAYEAIVRRFPQPFSEALEAREKLADIASVDGDWETRRRWLDDVVAADAAAGGARTDRSRYLAARAALELARPERDAFASTALTIPLDRSLKSKKARLTAALKAYTRAADYGVAEVTTAATFETADLYYQLSRDLLASQRPTSLSRDELEQYDLLLEEQAFPFEEKAIDLYRVNIERTDEGIYDEWVRASFARLAAIAPARFARQERSAGVATWID